MPIDGVVFKEDLECVCGGPMSFPYGADCGHLLCGLCAHRCMRELENTKKRGVGEIINFPTTAKFTCSLCRVKKTFSVQRVLWNWLSSSRPEFYVIDLSASTLRCGYTAILEARIAYPGLKVRVHGPDWTELFIYKLVRFFVAIPDWKACVDIATRLQALHLRNFNLRRGTVLTCSPSDVYHGVNCPCEFYIARNGEAICLSLDADEINETTLAIETDEKKAAEAAAAPPAAPGGPPAPPQAVADAADEPSDAEELPAFHDAEDPMNLDP